MTDTRQFRFAHEVTSSAFSRDLSHRVEEYFRSRGISRHANLEMYTKTVFGFAATIASYVWLMTGRFTALQVVGVYVVLGAAQLYMAFNIAHDANHGGYSSSKKVNKVLGCVFDLIGVSSYMWRLLHNHAHHAFINIRGADTTLISGKIFRFSPHDRKKPFHRYQHLYAPFIYCLSSLDWVLTKDFRWLFHDRFGNRRIDKHPRHELVLLFVAKAFYYTYMLVIPIVYLAVPWYAIVAGFIALHLVMGFTIALIFQPNHFNQEAAFPEADAEGHVSNNFIRHIFDTTSDYARANAFANSMLGCLNLHVIHHMFPGICHVHYPALTKIVKATAEEHGLTYRETRTITGAFLAHLRFLKVLGTVDEVALSR